MCEIFIIDPEHNEPDLIESNAADMFDSNPDGIGLTAVYKDGESFDYKVYKAPNYSPAAVRTFIEKYQDAWRMIVHARLATHGDTKARQTHPIQVDCEQCDIDYVIHNGVVNAEDRERNVLMDDGHFFNTLVDSEVIAHEQSTVPEDIEELEGTALSGSLNYILLSEDQILVRSGGRYRDTDEFLMGKRGRCVWEDGSKKAKYLLVSPDGEVQTKKSSTVRRSSSSTGSTSGSISNWGQGSYYANRSGDRSRSRNGDSGSRSGGGSRSGAGADLSEAPKEAYEDWEDWPPRHLAS